MRFRDPELQAHFEQYGYVQVDLLNATEVRKLRATWERLQGGLAHLPFSISPMSSDDTYRRQAHELTNAALERPISRYLEGHQHWMGLFLNKGRASKEGLVEMHQDWNITDESRHLSMSVWCPLVDVDLLNGCLFLVPGSHRIHSHPRAVGSALVPFDRARYLPLIGSYARMFPLKAGQALLFAHSLFHGSLPNLQGKPRPVAVSALLPKNATGQLYRQVRTRKRIEFAIHAAGVETMLDYYANKGISTPEVGRIPFKPVKLTEAQLHRQLRACRTSTPAHAGFFAKTSPKKAGGASPSRKK